MEFISRLRAILVNSLSNRGSQHSEQELFDELMVRKPCLLNVFDVGQRSAEEQRELESGPSFCALFHLHATNTAV